ncbi:MAG: hypothetical protein WC564_05410 [Patescibacteria group bacterium]
MANTVSEKKKVKNYNESPFWDKEARKIKLINPGDFHLQKLLVTLGVQNSPLASSFGVSDRKEILRRQEISKFFLENEGFRKFLSRINLNYSELPSHGQNFIDYFFNPDNKENNPFFQDVDEFLKRLGSKKLPAELASFVSFVKSTKDGAKRLEDDVMNKIFTELKKVTYLEGLVTVEWKYGERSIIRHETQGYRKYSFGERFKKRVVPAWMYKGLFKKAPLKWLTELRKYRVNKYNESQRQLFYNAFVVTETPPEIKSRILSFLEGKLPCKNLPHSLSDFYKIFLNFSYKYSENGLEITLLSFELDSSCHKFKSELAQRFDVIKDDFLGYSRWQLRNIRRTNEDLSAMINKQRLYGKKHEAFQYCLEKIPSLARGVRISSEEVDALYRWNKVVDLYDFPQFRSDIEEIRSFRNTIAQTWTTLKQISSLIDTLVEKSVTWKCKLDFPNVLDDSKHLISFDSIMPVSLVNDLKLKDLVAIKGLPSLNGQIFGFTGQNSGGKSVTQLEIINTLFLAQSGLPVFAENFSFNVKEVLGAVFIERGVSSTAALLLAKTENILAAIGTSKENSIFLVLDEVGFVTGELDGLEYGEWVLRQIFDAHVSTIFSTQIFSLASFAQDQLGAAMFQFNLDHQINPGIGRGNLAALIEKMGLSKLSKEKKS